MAIITYMQKAGTEDAYRQKLEQNQVILVALQSLIDFLQQVQGVLLLSTIFIDRYSIGIGMRGVPQSEPTLLKCWVRRSQAKADETVNKVYTHKGYTFLIGRTGTVWDFDAADCCQIGNVADPDWTKTIHRRLLTQTGLRLLYQQYRYEAV